MRTNRVFPAVLLCSFFLPISGSQGQASEDYPSESKRLLERLNEFETNERKKVEETIAAKRLEVAKVLETHLANETKKGNLDGAILLRKKIAELRAVAGTSDPVTEPEPLKSLVGTKWELAGPSEGMGEIQCEFVSEKELIWTHRSFVGTYVWEEKRRGEIEIAGDEAQLGQVIRMTIDYKKATGEVLLRRKDNFVGEARMVSIQ